jgi:hypothetical protein
MIFRYLMVWLVGLGLVLGPAGAARADGPIPTGERTLGNVTLEPGYDDMSGNIVYMLTPNKVSVPLQSSPTSWEDFFVVVYPITSTLTLNCMHKPMDNCPDHGPDVAKAAMAINPAVYGAGVLGHDHVFHVPGPPGGEFNFRGRVVGPTPVPVRAFAHWRAPAEGSGLLALAGPYPAGLPAGLVPLGGVVPGMGEHWARPGDLPLDPVYGIYGGRLVFIEYTVTAADLARGLERSDLPGTGGFGPVDHVELSCGAEESEMGPMTESHGESATGSMAESHVESEMGSMAEPHCEIHLFLVPAQERARIRP